MWVQQSQHNTPDFSHLTAEDTCTSVASEELTQCVPHFFFFYVCLFLSTTLQNQAETLSSEEHSWLRTAWMNCFIKKSAKILLEMLMVAGLFSEVIRSSPPGTKAKTERNKHDCFMPGLPGSNLPFVL